VIDAPYGRAEHRFPPAIETAGQVLAWAKGVVHGGGVAVALVTSVGKGLIVAAQFASAGLSVVAHRAIHHAVQRLRASGLERALEFHGASTSDVGTRPLDIKRPGSKVGARRAVVWLARDRRRLDARVPEPARAVALVSGSATEAGALAAVGADIGFAWSNAADRESLLMRVRATGASQVFVTGRCAADVVRALGGRARMLGPPRQMALFEELPA